MNKKTIIEEYLQEKRRKGGKSKSPRKLKAVAYNLKKANLALKLKRKIKLSNTIK